MFWFIGFGAVVLVLVLAWQLLGPRIPVYYVKGTGGVEVGPFLRRGAAERYARRGGLASIDPAVPLAGGRVVKR